MYVDSFTSKWGDTYKLESKGGTFYITKNDKTDSYSSDESFIRRKFYELKQSIGR